MSESERRSTIREAAAEGKQGFAVNPFLEDMALVVREKKFARLVEGITVKDAESELPRPVFYHSSRKIDGEPFIKFFKPLLPILPAMSRAGLLVLTYLCKELKPGSSLVALSRDAFVGQGHARATYYQGVNELLAFQIVARHVTRGYYFINPALLFNGNRVKMRHTLTKTTSQQDAE